MADAILAQSGIYAIRNTINRKMYIGRAIHLEKRKRRHFAMLKNGSHHSEKLQRAWIKYGPDAFIAETLIHCSVDNLEFFEQLCIDGFDSYLNGYNGCPISGAPMAGIKYSESRRNKLSKSLRGIVKSDEHRAKLANSLVGVKHPPERVAAIAAARRRPEARAATSARMMGNKNALGSKRGDTAKANYSASWTAERKAAQSARSLESWTPEKRAALSARMRANNPRGKIVNEV